MGEEDFPDKKKAHQKRRAGGKADKKKGKTPHEQELTAKQKNPKAFAIQNVTKVRTVSSLSRLLLKGTVSRDGFGF
jgi:hypothetical protein